MTTTPCYLTVLAELSDDQIAELAPLLEEAGPEDPDVAEALGENSVIRFTSVLEGAMPMNIMRWFSTQKISYLWQWESYYGTGEGAQYFEASKDLMHDIRIHEGLAVIPLTAATDPAKVEAMYGVIHSLNNALQALGETRKIF